MRESPPQVAQLFENACQKLIEPLLEDGEMSVGTEILVVHRAPTPVGATVRVTARLVARDGSRLESRLDAVDGDGHVADGRHTRAVLTRSRFEAALSERGGRNA